ncbi:hypothetical protein F4808DRAFT_470503 [Astrocystis sublimbata]|nr:hypothetical protein F4808DRAFT_470503 [Astrocystis sublimbata]
MKQPLICTSLRKRLDWTGLASSLLKSNGSCDKWKETQLDTHDVAIPISAQRVFRGIFLSPRDGASPEILHRVERLCSLHGGQDSGVFFLLEADDVHPNATHALMMLQLQMVGKWDLPIIPVESVAAVEAALATLKGQLNAAIRRPPGPASRLLPFCSSREPLARYSVNVLTDLTADFRDLIHSLSSDPEFESKIALLLGSDADKLGSFWTDEYLID